MGEPFAESLQREPSRRVYGFPLWASLLYAKAGKRCLNGGAQIDILQRD